MNSNNVLLIVCVVVGLLVLAYFAYDTYSPKHHVTTTTSAPEGFNMHERFTASPVKESFTATPVKEHFEETSTTTAPTTAPTQPENKPAGHMQGEVLSAQDLLPQCADSPYAQVIPNGQGSVNDGNLLNAGYHLGVNTVGSSLRNANLQLRSEPPNPQVKVSPWMQTTIEADINRRELEIGN